MESQPTLSLLSVHYVCTHIWWYIFPVTEYIIGIDALGTWSVSKLLWDMGYHDQEGQMKTSETIPLPRQR